MSPAVILTVPVFSTLCNEAFRLRRAVFIGEQNVPSAEEFDAADLVATHVVAVCDGEVCGTLRLIATGAHMKIGRVAVHADFRGRSIASAMMTHAMDATRTVAEGRFHLDAQTDKIAFYEKLGFRTYGDEFLDAGMPHRAMKTY